MLVEDYFLLWNYWMWDFLVTSPINSLWAKRTYLPFNSPKSSHPKCQAPSSRPQTKSLRLSAFEHIIEIQIRAGSSDG